MGDTARRPSGHGVHRSCRVSSREEERRQQAVAYRAAKNDTSDVRARGLLGRFYADEGKTDSLHAVLAWLEAHPGEKLQGTSTYERAAIGAHLGPDHWPQAVQLLELSLKQGQGYNIRGRLHWFADWQPLKDYAPFRKVLEPRG